MRALILAYWFAVSIPTALFFGSVCRWAAGEAPPAKPSRMTQERRKRHPLRRIGVAVLFCALLAACAGGGGGSPSAAAKVPAGPPVAAQSPPPTTPTPAPPVCPAGSNLPWPVCNTANVPPLPACPDGVTTPGYITVCQCPHQNTNGSSCVMYQPVFCPVGTIVQGPLACSCPPAYFDATHDTCNTPAITPTPPPTMSLTASPNPVQIAGGDALLTWTSSGAVACLGATGWPNPGYLAPNGQTVTPGLNATTTYTLVCQGPGGNAVASVTITLLPPTLPGTCPLPLVGTPPNCTAPPPPPAWAVYISTNATTIVDSSGCPVDFNGTPCLAIMSITDSFGGVGATCSMNGGTPQSENVNFRIGYADDGPHVVTFACTAPPNLSASASLTLMVKAPYVPQPDVFTSVNNLDGTYTFTWVGNSPQAQGGCSVELVSNPGLAVDLVPGGTPSGVARSGALSPAGDPWTATLICSGAPAGVPTITVNF